jgi:hypothetical protein
MPPRPTPPTPIVVTRVPHVFTIWGTIIYGISAITSIATVLIVGITGWNPPWWLTEPAFLYCFISAGIITMGRIESNKDARVFARLLRQKSEENKRRMN